jgi:hypothetical protein
MTHSRIADHATARDLSMLYGMQVAPHSPLRGLGPSTHVSIRPSAAIDLIKN